MAQNRPAKQRIPVVLGENRIPVGLLVFESRGSKQGSAFRYADSWLARQDSFALSPQLRLGSGWTRRSISARRASRSRLRTGLELSCGRRG